jgi:hypothetical protein
MSIGLAAAFSHTFKKKDLGDMGTVQGSAFFFKRHISTIPLPDIPIPCCAKLPNIMKRRRIEEGLAENTIQIGG